MKTLTNFLVQVCIVCLPIMFFGSSQPPTTLDYLTAPSMWKQKSEGDTYDYFKFTKRIAEAGMVINNVPHGGSSTFYLSNLEEHNTFDTTKVGKVESGSYIVISDPEEIIILKIENINADSITLFYDSKGKNIPDKGSATYYATYNND